MERTEVAGSVGREGLNELSRTTRLEEPIETAEHELLLLPGVEAILAAIQRDVERARRRVLIETYIYRDDRLGKAFAETMRAAARRGLDVRLLYDPLGSEETPARFFDDLRRRGLQARAYRPKETVIGRGSVWPRDHSRVIVIDDHAYTGGAAWGDQWLPERLGGEGWYDVCLQVAGPTVEDFARLFDVRWREATGEIDTPRDLSTDGKHPDVELVADAPDVGQCLVYQRHVEAIEAAEQRVWMQNAYFFPPPAMMRALYRAVARGVDVQILVPGETDLPIVKRAARAEYALWIERGLRLFEYQGRVLHSKYAVFDERLATVGSFNANPMSMVFTNEVNLFVRDTEFVRRLATQFERDRASSRRVTREAAAARPILQQVGDRLANDAINLVDVLFGSTARTAADGAPARTFHSLP